MRPFAPFNNHWYQGEFIFIFEPVLFVALLLGLILPSLVRDVTKDRKDVSQPFAAAAIAAMLLIWTFHYLGHARAKQLLAAQTPAGTLHLNPFPITPYRWNAVLQTGAEYRTYNVDLHAHQLMQLDTVAIPPQTPAIRAAEESWLGHVYLDWSQAPLVVDEGPSPLSPHTVTFSDLRFGYDIPLFHQSGPKPLGASALVDNQNRVTAIYIGDTPQRPLK